MKRSKMTSSHDSLRIPSNMIEFLGGYKRSTSRILEWLLTNEIIAIVLGSSNCGRSIIVQQLRQAVIIAHEQSIPVPEDIFGAFRSAIRYRQKVSKWFQSSEVNLHGRESESTKKHSYFTEV
ncbi:hypothetical protein NHQ30_010797 [Ciborinia camelliae]|nr:hypothetical protein NHQ30_010797 [Ciborinia camelliae]